MVSMANDELGYVMTAEQFEDDTYAYEQSMSMGPETGPIRSDPLDRIRNELEPDSKKRMTTAMGAKWLEWREGDELRRTPLRAGLTLIGGSDADIPHPDSGQDSARFTIHRDTVSRTVTLDSGQAVRSARKW